MKKYSLTDLYVIKKNRGNNTYQYFICEKHLSNYYEVFTKTKLDIVDKSLIEPLSTYYSTLQLFNHRTNKILSLTLFELLNKYNEINYISYNLETNEDIIINELNKHGIYEKSKTYTMKQR